MADIEEAIKEFFEDEKELHNEIDWWYFAESYAYNIHNYASKDVALFQIDAYPFAEGTDKPDYLTWDTVKTFNFNDYKKEITS